MKSIPLLLLLTGCSLSPVGHPYNEPMVARFPIGTATSADVKSAIGAPYRAEPLVKSEAPKECATPGEAWHYAYTDFKTSDCESSLYFDASSHLCSRKTLAPKRGAACSGVTGVAP